MPAGWLAGWQCLGQQGQLVGLGQTRRLASGQFPHRKDLPWMAACFECSSFGSLVRLHVAQQHSAGRLNDRAGLVHQLFFHRFGRRRRLRPALLKRIRAAGDGVCALCICVCFAFARVFHACVLAWVLVLTSTSACAHKHKCEHVCASVFV